MKILLYLFVPLLIVAVAVAVSWLRDRQPTSLEAGVDAFQREMRALSPDAAPTTRRRPDGSLAEDDDDPRRSGTGEPERRPPGSDR